LGRFDLSDIPPAPRGMPQIEVSFDIDANGIMHVSAKDKSTGKEQKIVIKSSSGLSDEEIEQMIQDAEANKEADQQFQVLVASRNQADNMVHMINKALSEVEDVPADERTQIETLVAELKVLVSGDDHQAIDEKVKVLTEASAGLMQKQQQAAAQAAGAEAQGPDTSDSPVGDEEVVDAEFEEVQDDK